MECYKIKEKINYHLDNGTDNIDYKMIMEHIEECKECREEFHKTKEIDNILNDIFINKELPNKDFRDNVINAIEEIDNSKFIGRNINMIKKRIAIAIMAVCIIGGSFVPIQGQSLAASVKDWVTNLIVENDNGQIICEDKDIEITPEEMKQLKEDAKNYNDSSLPTDDLKDIMQVFYVEPVIPERYSFSAGEHKDFTDDNGFGSSFYRLFYKTDMSIKEYYNQEFLEVDLHIQTYPSDLLLTDNMTTEEIDLHMEKHPSDIIFGSDGVAEISGPGFKFKEVSLLGKNAVIAKKGRFKELNLPIYNIGKRAIVRLSVAVRNSKEERTNDELIKIAESVLNQYLDKESEITEFIKGIENN